MTKLVSMLIARGFTVVGIDCADNGTAALSFSWEKGYLYIDSRGRVWVNNKEFHCSVFDDENEYADFDALTEDVENFLKTL